MSETHGQEENAEAEVQPIIPIPDDAVIKNSEKTLGPDDEDKPQTDEAERLNTSETHAEQESQPIIPVPDDAHLKSQAESTVGPSAEKEDVAQLESKPEELGTSPKEEEATAIPTAKPPRRLRSFNPAETVDINIGESGVRANKPMTIPQVLQQTCDRLPDGPALRWKDNKEGPWNTLTYIAYQKLIYNVAKSFLKVI